MGRETDDIAITHKPSIDGLTAILLLAIAAFGLFVLLTIDRGYFNQQLLAVAIGAVVLILFSRIDRELLWWFAPIGYLLGILLLLLSFASPSIRGSHRWLFVGPMQLQPSELIKPFLLLAFSRFMAQFSPRKTRLLPIHLALFFLPFLLVFRQPDLGTALVYLGTWGTMLLASGVSIVLVVVVAAITALVMPLLWELLAAYQKARILTFLNPALDPKGAGYNAIQAMIAVGSGQLAGRGLGRGTQSHLRFLPEYHTDFIFATLIEELGLVGGIVLLTAYVLLLARILVPLLRGWVDDTFHFTYASGLFAMILSQIFINTGMNMGILPITGITLPLVSYGGSSVLSIAASFGILWAFERRSVPGSVAIRGAA